MIESDSFENLLIYDFIGISMNIGTLNRFGKIYNFIMKSNKNKIPLIPGGCIPIWDFMHHVLQMKIFWTTV